ncbi:MAG: response regulator [Acidobacteria bacterium]|uniref:Response regulator n=1 Tax=Candidatus Polarisedimenticola svalbardensis TaxID=2886004 RepID=A0A8J6XTK7_9BACT|nr:response regulator [Candidatus Polarisedimenticola svalbardensis]
MNPNVHIHETPSILVVDDSDLLRNILREELEAEGYRVSVAEDGEKALSLAQDIRPDLILLDIVLPGMDGYEVCRELKSNTATSQIPVLFLSSRNELKDKLAGFDAGADDYLTKPFFTKELLARLRINTRTRESIETHRQVGDFYLQMLFGIGSAITSPFKVDDEINIMLRQAMVAIGTDRGVLLLHDPEEGSLQVRGVEGFDREGQVLGDRFRISEKLPQLGPDETEGGEIQSRAIRMYEDPERGTVFVPMVAKEKLVGGIELDVSRRSGKVTAQQQKVLYALASQAAIFIENARLEREIRSMFLNIIVSMAGAVDAKDAYTHGHSLRVARMSLLLGRMVDLPRDRMEPLLLAAILHDVGKIATPDDILKKPARLDDGEYEVMKEHPVAGGRMLSHIPALKDVIPGIQHHHEHWDGTGYPEGLAGDDIPLMGRIILIGDAFDAMTTDRIYRKAMPVPVALKELLKFAGKQFDPTLVQAAQEAYARGELTDDTFSTTPTIRELIDQIE